MGRFLSDPISIASGSDGITIVGGLMNHAATNNPLRIARSEYASATALNVLNVSEYVDYASLDSAIKLFGTNVSRLNETVHNGYMGPGGAGTPIMWEGLEGASNQATAFGKKWFVSGATLNNHADTGWVGNVIGAAADGSITIASIPDLYRACCLYYDGTKLVVNGVNAANNALYFWTTTDGVAWTQSTSYLSWSMGGSWNMHTVFSGTTALFHVYENSTYKWYRTTDYMNTAPVLVTGTTFVYNSSQYGVFKQIGSNIIAGATTASILSGNFSNSTASGTLSIADFAGTGTNFGSMPVVSGSTVGEVTWYDTTDSLHFGKSTNSGTSWTVTKISDGISQPVSYRTNGEGLSKIVGLATNGTGTWVVHVGYNAEGRLFVSTNDGSTWTEKIGAGVIGAYSTLVFIENKFVLTNAKTITTSTDGIGWTRFEDIVAKKPVQPTYATTGYKSIITTDNYLWFIPTSNSGSQIVRANKALTEFIEMKSLLMHGQYGVCDLYTVKHRSDGFLVGVYKQSPNITYGSTVRMCEITEATSSNDYVATPVLAGTFSTPNFPFWWIK